MNGSRGSGRPPVGLHAVRHHAQALRRNGVELAQVPRGRLRHRDHPRGPPHRAACRAARVAAEVLGEGLRDPLPGEVVHRHDHRAGAPPRPPRRRRVHHRRPRAARRSAGSSRWSQSTSSSEVPPRGEAPAPGEPGRAEDPLDPQVRGRLALHRRLQLEHVGGDARAAAARHAAVHEHERRAVARPPRAPRPGRRRRSRRRAGRDVSGMRLWHGLALSGNKGAPSRPEAPERALARRSTRRRPPRSRRR